MPYQRKIILLLLLIILAGLMLKVIDRQRRAAGFDIRGFLDGYKYTTELDTVAKTVELSTNVYSASRPDSLAGSSHETGDYIININDADAVELQKLPGIGPVLAKRIIDYRDSMGHFNAADDLLEVKGIGEVKLAGMKEHITFEKTDSRH